MKNKKILELCLSPGLGGLEMFVSSCYEIFSEKTECFAIVAPDTKLDKCLQINNKLHIKRSRFTPWRGAKKIAAYIDTNDVDIVHFHWNKDIIIAVLAKLLSRKKPKLILSRHMGMTRFKDDIYHRWLYKNIDIIHAVTQEVKEELQRFIPTSVCPKIEMIYLGVSRPKVNESAVKRLQEQYHLQEDDFIVGIVGRIEKPKGQHIVIEALSKLAKKNIKIFVVGAVMDESYFQELKKIVAKFGMQREVIFTGFTTEVVKYMQLFDAHVLATEHETFGLVVVEAMANRCVSLATRKGGPLEIINDGVDGLLFNRNSIELAKKLALLYEDRVFMKKLQEAGYTKVTTKFDKEKQLEELYNVF